MNLTPSTVDELAAHFVEAREPVGAVDLSRLDSILEHTPEDMTATVQCGMTLAAFQNRLAAHGQWVPLDPAHAEETTIGDLLAHDLSGPRRLGYGTVREYVIGLRVVLGSGESIRNGGKVVKNVAGYDLCRLFIGAKNTLGVIVEATFKLRPLPERETILRRSCESLKEASDLAAALPESIALDLHNLEGKLILTAAFAGAQEDVESQERTARAAGFIEIGAFEYDPIASGWPKASVPPSKVFEYLGRLQSQFVARVGNGVIYHEGARSGKRDPRVQMLMDRVKAAYDPKQILPEYSP